MSRLAALAVIVASGCGPKSSAPAEPAPGGRAPAPYELPLVGVDRSAFDVIAWAPTALAEARKHFPDAQLARLDAEGLSPSGLLDLEGSGEVGYVFVSPSATDAACMIFVSIDEDVVEVSSGAGNVPCAAPLPLPTCAAEQLLDRAVAAGIPVEGTWIRLWYGHDGAGWRVNTEDRNGDDYHVELADDCGR